LTYILPFDIKKTSKGSFFMLTIKDRRGDIIETLWDVVDYLGCGPIDPELLEARVRALISALVED
jgi:DNA-binding response OmpR family regulator